MFFLKIAIVLCLLQAFGEGSYVYLPIEKHWYDNNKKPLNEKKSHYLITNENTLVKRDSFDAYFNIKTNYNQLFYQVSLKVGSQKDSVTLLLDTGSSDIIINSAENSQCFEQSEQNQDGSLAKRDTKPDSICLAAPPKSHDPLSTITIASSLVYPKLNRTVQYESSDAQYMMAVAPKIDPLYNCTSFGVFDELESTSFKNTSVPLDIQYADGSTAIGYFGTDSLFIGDIEIPDIMIGVNTNAYLAKGVLGVGFSANQNLFQNGYSRYKNFPEQLKSVGLISKTVYAVYGMYGKQSSILFGAYDKSAYTEDSGLTLVPVVSYNPGNKIGSGPYYVSITLNSISFTSPDNNDTLVASGNAIAILDTGSSYSSIPYYIFNEIISKFNFKWSSQLSTFVISETDIPKDKVYITFNFQNAKIRIPLIDFTYPVVDGETLSNTGLRSISIMYGNGDKFLLGDDFLSSVYFVVDCEDNQVALGQANPKFISQGEIVIVEKQITDAIRSTTYDQIYGSNGLKSLILTSIDDPNSIQSINDSAGDLQLYQLGMVNDLEW